MRSIIFVILLFVCGKMFSQDPIFSQAFLVPETINPSFTGALRSTKVGVIHKSQWLNFGLKVDTNFAYFDTWFEGYRSGIGLNFLNHTESLNGYAFNQLNFNYTYVVNLNDTWYMRPSVSVGYGVKDYGFQDLLLGDQIGISTGSVIIAPTNDPVSLYSRISFFDFGSSIIFNNDNSWVGLTLRHLNKPNISMTEAGTVPLNIFLSVHANIEFPLFKFANNRFSDKNSLYILSNFMMQDLYNRFDIGTQYVYNNMMSFGFLLITSPLKIHETSETITSFNLFAGFKLNGFKFGYSYDANVGKIGQTGGIHEVSLTYDFSINRRVLDRYKCIHYF